MRQEGKRLSNDSFDDFSSNACEANIKALELGGKTMVIDAEQGQHGGVQIVDIDDVFHGSVAEFIGGAPGDAGLDAAPGHEDTETENVVIPPTALPHGGSAKLATPENERVLQEATLGEVLNESGGGLVHGLGTVFHPLLDVAVVVPGAVVELNHAHPALGETASQQAVGGKGAVAGFFDAVEVQRGLGLVFEVGEFRHAALHLEGHFILSNAGSDLGVVLLLGEQAVEALDFIHDLTLGALTDSFGAADVVDGVTFRLKLDALKSAGQHAATPLAGGDGLRAVFARGGEHDEAGQVL